ncbi:hypothetical protein C8Q73DRAFT_415093 [Cubamyces lactineus]|nr:hypothetical protein C8Q73DRAFT_415093 [Cubamyces lactineus]
MIAEDLSETYREPSSSQPYNISEWQTSLHPCSQQEDRVNWQLPGNPVIESLREKQLQDAANASPTHSARLSRSNDPPLAHVIAQPCRQTNSAHAAYRNRNMLAFPETPDVQEAHRQLTRQMRTVRVQVTDRSRQWVRKVAQRKLLRSGTTTVSAGAALQRRDTNEGIGQSSRKSTDKAKATLRSNHTDPTLASNSWKSNAMDDPMDEDGSIAGPSKLASMSSAVSSHLHHIDDENDGAPSSTPTPPPKHRNSSIAARSSSASKGKSAQYSALTESPTSLHQTFLMRSQSADASMSIKTDSAQVPQPSPVVLSPVSLAVQHGQTVAVSDGPPESLFPPPASSHRSPSLAHPRSQVQPQASSSHLPPAMSQSSSLSKPFVVPSPTPGATQSKPVHSSQRPPPPLGMRPNRPGAPGQYPVSKEPPKGTGDHRIPPFKPPTGNGMKKASGSSSGSLGSRSNSGSGSAMQGIVSQAVPDPPHVAAIPVLSRPPQVLEMSARRPEPGDAMDEGKEADSSYGDIPFDFDREALDEAMSAYDA